VQSENSAIAAVFKGYTKRIKECEAAYIGLIIETRQALYMGFLIKITAGPLEVRVLGLTILYSPPYYNLRLFIIPRRTLCLYTLRKDTI
jgi:hypothetical protein